jgi:hypothetical protein
MGDATARFWSKVDKSGECWVWTAFIGKNGYGQFSHESERTYAHRFSYVSAYGPIPPGLCVCHHCDNRACVRPDHFFLGTRADNLADMRRKGRGSVPPRSDRRGERVPGSKLTAKDVLEIRRLAAAGVKQVRLAETFGIAFGTVSGIVRRRTWRHI